MRYLLGLVTVAALACLAADADVSLFRGELVNDGPKPMLVIGGQRLELAGDEESKKVFADERLSKSDFEVKANRVGDRLQVEPFHKHALFMYQNGKRMVVSYWCDVCYIRTYAPGKCVCCQKYTLLDPEVP